MNKLNLAFCLAALVLILWAGVAESQSVRRDVAASKAEEPVRSQQANPGVGMAGGVAPKNFPSQDPAGIFDGQGNFDANAYVKAAKAYGTPAMINERFGNPWTAYHQSISPPTWSKASSFKYVKPANPGESFYYSRGAPCTTTDDYSSNYAQVAYVTDSAVAASKPGVDGIQTLNKDHCVWAGQPQPSWTLGNGHPTVTLKPDLVAQKSAFGMPQQPVEVTRAYGASEAAGCSYMVFQGGQVACGEGGNTAVDFYYFKPFPANFVPTAASVTNAGEFLLVTGWNTDSHHGQLAVVAIGSSKPARSFWDFEWTETYPGFRNYSLPVFTKLLGIIDLPGMAAPTAVEAGQQLGLSSRDYLAGKPEPGTVSPLQPGQLAVFCQRTMC